MYISAIGAGVDRMKEKKKKRWFTKWWHWLLSAIAGIVFLALIFNDGKAAVDGLVDEPIPTKEDYGKAAVLDYRSAMLGDISKGTLLIIDGGVLQIASDKNILFATKRNAFSESGFIGNNVWLVFKEKPRFLADDAAKVYGRYMGTYKYKSVLGSAEEVPSVQIDYYEIIGEK